MTRLSPVFLATAFALAFSSPVLAQDAKPELQQKVNPQTGTDQDQDKAAKPESAPATPDAQKKKIAEGTMTLEKMGKIIRRLDDGAKRQKNGWQFTVEKVPVVVVTDRKHNRMRILIAIRKTSDVSPDELTRMMQANFDTALDARYAIAHDIVWATFIHPLSELHDRQFITAVGQTVNLATTYGSTFSSGVLSFGAGDSRGIIQRQLIENLLKKGEPI